MNETRDPTIQRIDELLDLSLSRLQEASEARRRVAAKLKDPNLPAEEWAALLKGLYDRAQQALAANPPRVRLRRRGR